MSNPPVIRQTSAYIEVEQEGRWEFCGVINLPSNLNVFTLLAHINNQPQLYPVAATRQRPSHCSTELKNPALKVQGFKVRLKVASILQNEYRIVFIFRTSMMLQIRLHHRLCHIPCTPRPVPGSPKMLSPIPLF